MTLSVVGKSDLSKHVASASNPEQVEAATWRDYFLLTKPTISMLVVVTAVPGFLLPLDSTLPSPMVALAVVLGTWLASASAAVFNQFIDADIDAQMARTMQRPLPAGRVEQKTAFTLATFLGIAAFAMLYFFTTPLAAWVSVAGNLFYVLVYTMYLKRRTVQNIVIGGAAGAVGPLIGWAAVTGGLAWEAWALFLLIFLWTPPHFWALALKYKDDYARAKVPMMPVVRGDEVTRKQMFWYTLSLVPVVVSLAYPGQAGWLYLVPSLALTLWFVWLAWRLYRSHSNVEAMPLFHFSCLYLFGVFGALTLDKLVMLLQ